MPNPEGVEIGDDVDPDKISGENVRIYSGCKIFGNSTLILPGSQLGYEAPATIEDCIVGPKVQLDGGYFKGAVFLKGAKTGSGSHIRQGTILEEQANVAHTVGLKQTILFPFVTLGSLINFCDCLMSGGTSRENHSEVGSSYIHFNYTPNQDKATPSLLGDVPKGVMLNQPPIFLGGQGGLVGPCRIAFGTTIAAGSIYRKDEFRTGRLIIEGVKVNANISYTQGLYQNVKRTVLNNLIYISNLIALLQWYVHVRALFVSTEFPDQLLEGLIDTLKMNISERIKQLRRFRSKLPDSVKLYQLKSKKKDSQIVLQKNELFEKWPEIEDKLIQLQNINGDQQLRDIFLNGIDSGIKTNDKDYVTVIQQIEPEIREMGEKWLQGIIDTIINGILNVIPSFK